MKEIEIVEAEFVEEDVNTREFLYPWEEKKDDFFDDPEYLEARRTFAARRANKHLCHSFEIGWDAHDQPRQDTSQPTDWGGVAKRIIFIVFIIGIAVWVAW